MALFDEAQQNVTESFYKDWPTTTLKILIILWAVAVILLALFVSNKWLLAVIAAWEILP